MGKKVKLDILPVEENGKSTAPELDIIPVDEVVEVKKKDDTTVSPGLSAPPSDDGGTASPKPAEPSAESTPEDKYKRRVADLTSMYQQKFIKDITPFVESEQKQYEQKVSNKFNELQQLVDQKKLNVDQANDQLKLFSQIEADSTTARLDEHQKQFATDFDKANESSISSWIDRYSKDYEREAMEQAKRMASGDFQKNKERNPIASFGKNLYSTMRYQLPADLIGGSMAMEKLPFDMNEQIFKPIFDPLFGDKKREIKLPEGATAKARVGLSPADERRKIMLKQAMDLRTGGEKANKYLVNSLDKAEDFVDYMNWAGAAIGQAGGQIPAALLTRGGTAYGQEIGTIYLDGVNKIAEENNMTAEQVMEKGMDESLYPMLFGYAAGKLDMIGAKGVAESFNKKEIIGSLRDRALGFAKSTGKSAGKESITEGAQTVLEQIGVSKAAGQSWSDAYKSIDPNEVKEAMAQGLVGAGGLSIIGKSLEKTYNKFVVRAPGDIARKTPQQVIQESTATIQSSGNVDAATAAADTIQEKVNQVDEESTPTTFGKKGIFSTEYEVVGKNKNGDLVGKGPNGLLAVLNPDGTIKKQEFIWSKPSGERGKERSIPAPEGDFVVEASPVGSVRPSQETMDLIKKKPPEEPPATGGAQVLEVDESVIEEKMRPSLEKMVDIETQFRNRGYDINWDYDNEIQILDKKGEIVEPNDLPDDLKSIAGDYEGATKAMGEFTPSYGKLLDKVRAEKKGIETEYEVVEDRPAELQQVYENAKKGVLPKKEVSEALKQKYGDKVFAKALGEGLDQWSGDEKKGEQANDRKDEVNAILENEDLTTQDIANEIEALEDHPQYNELQAAVKKYQEEIRIDREEHGMRGDPDQYESEFIDEVRKIVGKKATKKVFVYGTLQDPKTRKKILGEEVTSSEATVPGMVKEEGEKKYRSLAEALNAVKEKAKIKTEPIADILKPEKIRAINEKYDKQVTTPPTEPPQTPPPAKVSAPLGPEQGNRQTVEKLQEESKLDDTLKEAIEDFQKYTVRKQEKTQSEARRTIDRLGEDEALREATSFKLTRSVEQKIALLSELAERFSTQFREATKKGDTKTAEKAYDQFMATMDELSARITDAAQAVSYMNLVGRMFETKTGAVRFATRQIDESREGAMRNHEDTKLTIERVLEEFDKLSKEDFMKSRKVQELMADVKKTRSIQSRIAHKKLNESAARLRDVWNSAKQVGIVFDPKSTAKHQIALDKALRDYIRDLIKTIIIDTAETIKSVGDEVKKEFQAFLKSEGIEVTDKDASDLVSDELGKQTAKQLEKKYKKDLKEALTDFANGKIKNVDELVDQIATTEQLTPEQAADFAKRFKSLFDEYATEQKQKLIKKYTPKAKTSEKTAKQKTEFYDKIIQLSNVGAVSDRQMDDALAQIFGLPAMTPEIAAKIEDMVDKINKAPEGRFKNIAITELTDYIAQQQKFNVTNYMLSSYKAGIFSGIDTQALNLQGNMFNVLELGFMVGLTNPRMAARFFKAFANPNSIGRASSEALQTLQTGYDPRNIGDDRRALERTERSFFGLGKGLKGAKQLLDPTLEQQKKYVFRALSAGDILFSTSISDALQSELFRRRAKEMGLKGAEGKKYVREQMGYTPGNIAAQGQKAEQEAKAGMIPNDKNSIALRTYELIEQQRSQDVVQLARQYASDQILTNTPKGYIGIAARSLNNLIRQIPILSAMIPVVNFAANAMGRAVQYMPHTVAIRAAAYAIRDKSQGIDFTTQIRGLIQNVKSGDFETEMRLRRAAIGMMTMAILIALLSDDDEDENILSKLLGKKVKIHGMGPGTQFNRQKTYQLQESGWLPYSIQIGDKYIPYKNYPALNVLLASMGEWNDAVRYGKLDRKDAAERFIFAMGNSFKVISEMGFLTSINTLLSAMLQGEVKSFVDIPTRIATGFAFPKFQRNLSNLFDNKVYSGGDILEMTTRSMPVVNTFANEPLVNALGEPVEKNWWDRVALWNTDAYSKHKPLWSANSEKKYFFTVPTRFSLEQKFDRPLTSKEYNEYFRVRGEEIVKDWDPNWAKLSPEKYNAKMDRLVRYADYKALVKMGVMKSDVMKDIRYELDEVNEVQRGLQDIKKEIFK